MKKSISVLLTPAMKPKKSDKLYVYDSKWGGLEEKKTANAFQGLINQAWNNSKRGQVPVATTIAPLLAEIAPPPLRWYHDNLGPNAKSQKPNTFVFLTPRDFEATYNEYLLSK